MHTHLARPVLGQEERLVALRLGGRGRLLKACLADLVVVAAVHAGLRGAGHTLVVGCVPAGHYAVGHGAILRMGGMEQDAVERKWGVAESVRADATVATGWMLKWCPQVWCVNASRWWVNRGSQAWPPRHARQGCPPQLCRPPPPQRGTTKSPSLLTSGAANSPGHTKGRCEQRSAGRGARASGFGVLTAHPQREQWRHPFSHQPG